MKGTRGVRGVVSECQSFFPGGFFEKRSSLNELTTTALCLAYDRCHGIGK
jgi:hypothetical protein